MKTLIATIIATTLIVPSLSFAGENLTPILDKNDEKTDVLIIQKDISEQNDHKMNRHNRDFSKHGKDSRHEKIKDGEEFKKSHKEIKDFESLTLEEQNKIFQMKIEKMERKISKVEDPELKQKIMKDLEEFKTLSIEDKKNWIKENHQKRNKNYNHFKKMCESIENKDFAKLDLKNFPSNEEILEKIKSSQRFKQASEDDKKLMMERYNEMSIKTDEEKIEMFEKRKNKIKERCENIKD